MRWFAKARARLVLWFAPRAVETRMEEEFGFHVDMEAERLVREEGLSPEEARRRALVTFGGMDNYREELRDGRGLRWLSGMTLDLKLGLRMLVKYPGLTLVALLALSVAIGGGAAYLELVNDVYRPSLPFAGGDRVVGLYNFDIERGTREDRSLHDFVLWRRELKSVEELGAYRALDRNLVTSDGRAEPVRGVEISPSAFRIVPARPVLGRTLVDEDAEPGASPVVVIGYSLWQSRFGGDAGLVGRSIRLGHGSYTVVGIMPDDFGFPVNQALWLPLQLTGGDYRQGDRPPIRMFGRLAGGVSHAAAQAELAAIGARTAKAFPETNEHLQPRIKPYVAALTNSNSNDRAQIIILYAVNAFFLGLLCMCAANIATLVFARTATRESEITVRNALGASRGRIVAQLFAEALVLTSLAAAVGLGGAWLALSWVQRTISASTTLPFWWNTSLAPATFLYAAAITVLAAIMVGVVPALKATGPQLQTRLKDSAAGGATLKFGGLWTGVIVTQVAFTVMFLMMVVAFGWNVRAGRYGLPTFTFDTDRYVSARVEMDRASTLAAPESDAAFQGRFHATYEQLAQRLSSEPAVSGVTFASHLPGTDAPHVGFEVDGAPRAAADESVHWVRVVSADPEFLNTFDAKLVSGRAFNTSDAESDHRVAIVDETFARVVMGGRDVVGRRIREAAEGDERPGEWYEIVGVVRTLTAARANSTAAPVLYRPAVASTIYPLNIAIRMSRDANALAPRLRTIAAAVDPSLRIYNPMPMTETGQGTKLFMGIVTRAMAVICFIALLLSTAGVYSLMAFTVARRTREIGIRAAVGADRGRILTGIFSRSVTQVSLGVLAGSLPGSLLVARGLPEVAAGGGNTVGLMAFAAVGGFMLLVGLLATLVPALRALRIQPTEALRPQ